MTKHGRRRFILGLAAGGAGALVAACLSPTLPLPPPGQPDVERLGQNTYRLTGVIPEPGRVEALNLRSKEIFGLATDRDYAFNVTARPGDEMQLWYTVGNDASESFFFEIDPRLSGPDAGPGDAGVSNDAAGASSADAGASSDAGANPP